MESERVFGAMSAPVDAVQPEASGNTSTATNENVSVWKIVKWVAYRLPILANLIVAAIFLTKDGLAKSQSLAILLIVNTFRNHFALVLVSLLMFLFLCAGMWGLADYFDRPYIWRARR